MAVPAPKKSSTLIDLGQLGKRCVVADFEGGSLSSDGGVLLFQQLEQRFAVVRDLAGCFRDLRNPEAIEHSVEELLRQRLYALAQGYEDLNDHDFLMKDCVLAVAVGKTDPLGETRQRPQDQGKPLAGKSTLNRLELTPAGASSTDRYKKIVADPAEIQDFFLDQFIKQYPEGAGPQTLILDVDTTDDPVHGRQEGRHFHGYYDCYCYLPLYVFVDGFPLWAELLQASQDPAQAALKALQRLIPRIFARWPKVKILLRGDSGFCRDALLSWCEAQKRQGFPLDYLLGLPRNKRLEARSWDAMKKAMKRHAQTQQPARAFAEFRYRTRDSWSRKRRVIAKAEYLAKGANPRFVVTSLATGKAQELYEQIYCARGDMENRIKEQQGDLFADRTSTAMIRANQLRLFFSTVAYLLIHLLRVHFLQGTVLEKAQCGTLRLRLFKVGVLFKASARRLLLSFSSCWPFQSLFTTLLRQIALAPA
jgi:Transposase DDE domain group 1